MWEVLSLENSTTALSILYLLKVFHGIVQTQMKQIPKYRERSRARRKILGLLDSGEHVEEAEAEAQQYQGKHAKNHKQYTGRWWMDAVS